MNGLRAQGEALARGLAERAAASGPDVEWLVCPPFTLLAPVGEALEGTSVALGAQDCHPQGQGAYTGDIAADMLRDLGCAYVIVGHSERRHGHGERSELVRGKAEAAARAGLKPIVCVGECERQRVAGKTLAVLEEQLADSLPDACPEGLVVAYEPVWAIGTGKTATPADVEQAHGHIRGLLAHRYGEAGRGVRLLYGGSVKPGNAGELLRTPDVDGALVGGASLKLDDFWGIGEAAA
ncbi:triose-phosphate isomerase [Ferruginivarius sediminum]|uniref:Triosephosphate isomerase n=2 Tax=Ferruginivarius sediminum TaxID=2661937 RepID=A0A369TA71_9PROT|nr:triose-phosphate isomerase [Ferruginivarius sediminum]